MRRAVAAAVAGDAAAEAVAAADAAAAATTIAAAAAAAVQRSDRQRRARATVRAAAAVPHSVNAHAGTGRSVYAATGSFHSVAVDQLLCETVSCWSCWSFDSTVCPTAHFLGNAAWRTGQLRECERALLALISLTLTPRGKPLVRGACGTHDVGGTAVPQLRCRPARTAICVRGEACDWARRAARRGAVHLVHGAAELTVFRV